MEFTIKRFVRNCVFKLPAVIVATALVTAFHTALFPVLWVFKDDVRCSDLWMVPIEYVKECY